MPRIYPNKSSVKSMDREVEAPRCPPGLLNKLKRRASVTKESRGGKAASPTVSGREVKAKAKNETPRRPTKVSALLTRLGSKTVPRNSTKSLKFGRAEGEARAVPVARTTTSVQVEKLSYNPVNAGKVSPEYPSDENERGTELSESSEGELTALQMIPVDEMDKHGAVFASVDKTEPIVSEASDAQDLNIKTDISQPASQQEMETEKLPSEEERAMELAETTEEEDAEVDMELVDEVVKEEAVNDKDIPKPVVVEVNACAQGEREVEVDISQASCDSQIEMGASSEAQIEMQEAPAVLEEVSGMELAETAEVEEVAPSVKAGERMVDVVETAELVEEEAPSEVDARRVEFVDSVETEQEGAGAEETLVEAERLVDEAVEQAAFCEPDTTASIADENSDAQPGSEAQIHVEEKAPARSDTGPIKQEIEKLGEEANQQSLIQEVNGLQNFVPRMCQLARRGWQLFGSGEFEKERSIPLRCFITVAAFTSFLAVPYVTKFSPFRFSMRR
eukprot:gb/GEZN01005457.1/.p1 GENE.gb/GEZN01005457.1/~~gb/GEZN01005457.1/.p1  ORF type:complete len:506 (-),score=86.94 gb/GEZN01005457.1/:236-1753(-)